ncbi:MAG: ATP-binding protein [Vicinamibacterales bacterium]|nr:ATP-binding protein [Vicinamibacterales bacterium]
MATLLIYEEGTVPSPVNQQETATRRYMPLVAFAAAIALLLMAGLAARNTSRRMVESSAAVDDSHALLLKLDDIGLTLSEIVSNTRGFLFTGLDVFVRPLDGYRQVLDRSLDDLERDLAQKPEQLERVAELRTLVERRLALNDEYLRMRRENDVQGALDAIPAGGEQIVQQIRDQLAAIGSVEVARLDQQRSDEVTVRDRAQAMMTLAGVISLLILSFAFLALRRQVIEREQAEVSLHSVEDQLRQSQKMEAIGRLASGVAHDFNNLLTIIRGHCDRLLRQHPGNSSVEKSARSIIKTGDRGAALTGQLLAFSRKQVLRADEVDLNAVVRDMLAMVSRTGRDDIELVTDLVDDLPAVRADRGQLDQVVLNLVVNAQDAMPSGGQVTIETGTVRLSPVSSLTGSGLPPGSYARLTVRDTGVGMDTETQNHIFEPFFTTKDDKGTGLGLATVYGIVRQSGGHITVESELEIGTSFTVLLPPGDGVEPSAAP